jgi:hypothetical protein
MVTVRCSLQHDPDTFLVHHHVCRDLYEIGPALGALDQLPPLILSRDLADRGFSLSRESHGRGSAAQHNAVDDGSPLGHAHKKGGWHSSEAVASWIYDDVPDATLHQENAAVTHRAPPIQAQRGTIEADQEGLAESQKHGVLRQRVRIGSVN